MKIEKLNDRQIRCTLRQSDLTSRHLKISELAYGSAKAKELFRDIMKQASNEFGFETDDLPLMIEAIPVNAECVVLIVTKVEDPEELDTRFSRFSQGEEEEDDGIYAYDDDYESLLEIDDSDNTVSEPLSASEELEVPDDKMAQDVLNIFNKVKDIIEHGLGVSDKTFDVNTPEGDYTVSPKSISASDDSDTVNTSPTTVRIFSFDNFETVVEAASSANLVYSDKNSLYKDVKNSLYYLVLEKHSCTSVEFNKVCNILSEYGSKEYSTDNRLNYFKEHFTCICKDRAIQIMAKI